jgi:hypothetical protein
MGSTLARRAIDKALRLSHLPPLHRLGNDAFIPWQRPIRAPHSISYHILHALRKRGTVRFYSIYEKGPIHLGEDDIFIGQPIPRGGFSYTGRPESDDPESITSATLRLYTGSGHKKILIMPYANDPMLVGWAKDLAERYANGLILIGGEIWTRNWEDTPFGSIDKRNITRLDMGIDMDDYPLVKKQFNAPGKRRYLYIGHTAWYKNTAELERIARAMPEYEFAHIGNGDIKGWKKISGFAKLTPTYMRELAKQYDIFVSTSSADAQATTILEQMCFGLVVACTHESGYEYSSLVRLSTFDTSHNVRALLELQCASEAELVRRVSENRKIAAHAHSWKLLCDTVTNLVFE